MDKYWHVLRITPKRTIKTNHPWPVPTLKIRETCKTEFNLLPNARNEINYLRYKTLEKYYSKEYEAIDLNTNLWVMESFEGILMDVNVLGESRDALYLRTNSFELTSDDDFVITYGVNNYQEAFIGFRLYLNQETLVGPAPYDVIWDQAILFRKKRDCQH
ncbi:hypothetical protein ACN077_09465 [Clostridium chromiireducens]|uniref:hypothetical protein n=1 Tax=Clostridium chromiireducens TaxID=225345 RepID=UPI003AF9FAE8